MLRHPAAHRLVRALVASALACVAFLGTTHVRAQAVPDMYKTQTISVFGAYSRVSEDFFPESGSGVSFGLDLTRHINFPVQPALELRATLESGYYARERSYTFGPKLHFRYHRVFRPYADFLIGIGDIHFNPPAGFTYLGDNSTVYSPGGGVDISLVHNARLKVEYQRQYWSIGKNYGFQPGVFSLGVAYPLPFAPFSHHGQPHY